MSTVAVLTGDLVQSTRASADAVTVAMATLTHAAQDIAIWAGADTRFTRFRGDGWQMVLTQRQDLALRAALYLTAALKAGKGGLQTRVAVAEGEMTAPGSRDLSDAMGPAFTMAGRVLDEMKGQITLALPGMTPIAMGFLELLGPLLARWTPEQAEAMRLALVPRPPTRKEMARSLQISEQAVSLRLRGAHEAALLNALRHWEQDRQAHHG